LRSLSVEIKQAAQRIITDLELPITVGIRSGDTTASERAKQKTKMPDLLITTPESLQLLLATKEYPKLFAHCSAIVIDEWHELLGTKRGVQTELGLSRLKTIAPNMRIWGISATIGNLEQARQVLLGIDSAHYKNSVLVRAHLHNQGVVYHPRQNGNLSVARAHGFAPDRRGGANRPRKQDYFDFYQCAFGLRIVVPDFT
jgi:ATP-dependent Lhr-like helicase